MIRYKCPECGFTYDTHMAFAGVCYCPCGDLKPHPVKMDRLEPEENKRVTGQNFTTERMA